MEWAFLSLHQEAGGVGGSGVQGVEGDHGVGQVKVGEHRPEDGDLLGLRVDLALGCDQAGSGHRGEQVDLGAVGTTGAADGLTVHGQRAAGALGRVLVAGGSVRVACREPGADCRVEGVAVDGLQDPAHGGLGRSNRSGRFAGQAAEGAEHASRGVGGPLRDRGQGLGAGQYRARGECADVGEGVATSLGPAGIGHRREVVQQLRVFPGHGGPGVGELTQASGDGR